MLDLIAFLVSLFLIIGVFMAVHAVRESRDLLRVITRILMRWSANERPEIFEGLKPSPVAVSLQDGQKGWIEMSDELFECLAKGTIDAGDVVTIAGISGRAFIIEKAKA